MWYSFSFLFSAWKTHQKNEMRLDLKEDAYERQDASTAYNVSTANSNDSLEFVKKRTRRGEKKTNRPEL